MPSITITADNTQATSAMNAFAAALDKADGRIAKITQSVATFNKDGEQTGAVVRGMTKDGEAFTATFARVGSTFDQVTKKAITFKTELQKITYDKVIKSTDDLVRKTTALEAVFARTIRSAQYFLTYRAFNFITNSIQEGIVAAKDFQIQLSLIRTISQENQQTFSTWASQIRKVSDQSGVDIAEIGKGFYDTVSNQIAKGADVAPFVKTATDLARVTGSTLPDAVNTLSSTINAYNLSASDAAKISAVWFKVVDEGRVVLSEVANTIGRVQVLGEGLGVTYEELGAVIAVTTQKGFKTSDAMTLLTNLMIKLEKPTEATAAFFKSLGVDSGAAAVKLLGFNGVLRAMVESVKSGQTDVSAFFDEIRGRKQFAVFQQSIDQIESLSNRLKDTSANMKNFNDAVEIRGESPADKLVKETNKLKNVFSVDFGQNILEFGVKVVEAVGGTEKLSKNLGLVYDGVIAFTRGLIILIPLTTVLAIKNYAAARSYAALWTSAKGAGLAILAVGAAVAGYEMGKSLFGRDKDVEVNIENYNGLLDTISKIKKEAKDLQESANRKTAIDTIGIAIVTMNEEYKKLIGLLAQAQIANDRFLDSTKLKSKEAAEALKISFAGFTDTLKNNISEIKKQITEANKEIEKSAKFMMSFGDTIDEIIFKSQTKFATDEQKIDLTEQKINTMVAKIKELYASGDEAKIEEARSLAKEAVSLIATVEESKIELSRKAFEEYLKANPSERSPYGPDVFTASTLEEQKRLFNIKAMIAELEKGNVKNQEKQITNAKQMAKDETDRLRKLEQGVKAYEQIDIYDKAGKIKPEYRKTGGQFDPAKLAAEMERVETQIAEAGGSFSDRIQIMQLLHNKRMALNAEAAAAERSDFLKTAKDKAISDSEAHKADLENIKKRRDEAVKAQQTLIIELSKRTHTLEDFGRNFFKSLPLSLGQEPIGTKEAKEYQESAQKYKDLIAMIADPKNQIRKGDTLIADPNLVKEAADEYDRAMKILIAARDKLKKDKDLGIKVGDTKVQPGETAGAVQQEAQDFLKNYFKLVGTFDDERNKIVAFDIETAQPLAKLKEKFPELALAADTAAAKMNQSFKDFADTGLKAVEDRLRTIQGLMGGVVPAPGQEQGFVGGGGTYAASGGLAGAFPGQPKGLDKYPIWAAKGEYIVNAASTKMFLPMLKAISDRRYAPRYMASGGMVGDTNIGDVTVHVSSGTATPSTTGRVIARELERELRRRTINLTRR